MPEMTIDECELLAKYFIPGGTYQEQALASVVLKLVERVRKMEAEAAK